MRIKVLGSGCKKCVALANNVSAAAQAAGIEAEIEKVTDIVAISSYGIMSTPGLVIEEKVVSAGRVLPVEDIRLLLQAARSGQA